MMENKKYYVVKSLMLANSLTFITGQKPYVYDSLSDKGKQVFSFINSEELQEALSILNEAKNKLRK